MNSAVFGVLLAFLVLVVIIFLAYRLRLFSGKDVSGRFVFLTGGILIFLTAVWLIVKALPVYPTWFIDAAYYYIDVVHFIIFVGGILLVVAGLALYSDFWQTAREEIDFRDQKLSILSNLQHDAGQPYQLMELLNIAIKEIVANIPESAGAIFLINRTRRQFVLTASLGLNKKETASLEYYPLERNLVSQAVDLSEAMIAGSFDFIDRDGVLSESRFKSSLVLPMISGQDKIGGILLFSEKTRHFGTNEIKYLNPVAGWLAEKIKSARLSRDLSLVNDKLEKYRSDQSDIISRIISAAVAFSSGDVITAFCGSLVGLVSSETVHLIGLVNGSLYFHGGNEPLFDLTENYKTALIDALDRNKPLIVNQEASDDSGRTYVAVSTLIYPFGKRNMLKALILRRESSPFKVSETELKIVEIFVHLAEAVFDYDDIHRINISRRKGFNKILELLRFDSKLDFEKEPTFLMDHLNEVFPRKSKSLTFVRGNDGAFRAVEGAHVKSGELMELSILPGEGDIGQLTETFTVTFTTGRKNVEGKINSYESHNREIFYRLFGEEGLPSFMAICPLIKKDEIAGAMAVFMFDISETEAAEWDRMLTLASGLYSVRLAIDSIYHERQTVGAETVDNVTLNKVVNELNNRLSGVIGNAELAQNRADLSGGVRAHFGSIIKEAEKAAVFLKDSLGNLLAGSGISEDIYMPAGKSLNETIELVLERKKISENLYMIEGHTREINCRLHPTGFASLPGDVIEKFIVEVISYFASLTRENDIISIALYPDGDYVFLDISRHLKNFPPVERVAGFGKYEIIEDVLSYRPADSFLGHLVKSGCFYAYDRFSQVPSYLSIKFPVKETTARAKTKKPAQKRILAIDDQTVILDLITAMCQSLGYEVHTSVSGEEGLALASGMQFDIVLTDLAMPGMSGLEVARHIRQYQPMTPIYLITGWEANIGQDQLEKAGIDGILYKPFRIEQLSDLIRSVHNRNTLL